MHQYPMVVPVFKLGGSLKLADLGPLIDRCRLRGICIPDRFDHEDKGKQTPERHKGIVFTTLATVEIQSCSVMKNSM